MKVIVLMIVVITLYGCGIKPSVSCNVNDINTVIDDCKKLFISIRYYLKNSNYLFTPVVKTLTGLSKSQNLSNAI